MKVIDLFEGEVVYSFFAVSFFAVLLSVKTVDFGVGTLYAYRSWHGILPY